MSHPPPEPARIVIARTLRSAAERRLAAIATLHQPITSTSDLNGPSCGQCAGRWPCSTALVLGPWPGEMHASQVGLRIVVPEGKTSADTRTAAIAALHQPVPWAGPLAALSGPVCRQCFRWPCATAQLIGAWPSLQLSVDDGAPGRVATTQPRARDDHPPASCGKGKEPSNEVGGER